MTACNEACRKRQTNTVEQYKIFTKKYNVKDLLTVISGLLLLLGALFLFFSSKTTFPWSTLSFAAAILTGIIYPAQKAWQALQKGLRFDMNALMVIAVLGAAGLGEWLEGAAVVFLFALGNSLENYTMGKTRRSLLELMEMAPREATLWQEGKEKRVPVEQLDPGLVVVIRPGERIPVDGQIIEGTAAVDEAAITGEFLPAFKMKGSKVFAGTLNTDGFLKVSVSKKATDTILSGIIRLVDEARQKKAPAQRMIDSFAAVYTPTVIALAAALAFIPPLILQQPFSPWIYRALTLLLISCPCALVISTPVAVFSAISSGAGQGILFKGGLHLEQAGEINTVALDKTGTLTTGAPRVTEIKSLPGTTKNELLHAASLLSSFSEHPLARAIKQAVAADTSENTDQCQDFQALPGKGVKGTINGRVFYMGSQRFLEENLKINLSSLAKEINEQEKLGRTIVFLGLKDKVQGYFVLSDRIKEKSKSALRQLRDMHIKTVLITGDNKETAALVAKELQIADYRAELLPGEKLDIIHEMQKKGHKVAMVGDGINDAPSLAAANLGIAVGGGTDTALENAGVAMVSGDIGPLPAALKLGRRARAVIKQNVFLAIGLKLLALAAVFPGWLTLWLAVAADTGVSLLVILNAMRLLKK